MEDNKAEMGRGQPEGAGEAWIKPEISSFEPVTASEGISDPPADGRPNQTP